MLRNTVIFSVLLFLFIKSTFANVINKVFIEGNQRIESNTILSYLNIKKNREITEEDLNIMFKDLFATDLFSNISFDFDNNSLFIKVEENPIINRIALEGNKRIKDEDILSEIFLKPRDIFTLNKAKNSMQTILGIYRGNGRYAAIVEPRVIFLEQNRVDLIFEITEGPQSRIKFINFLGNSFFSDRELRSEILTKEHRWWKVLSSGGKFDPDLLNFDELNLEKFYANKGFVDANIELSQAELSHEKDLFFITINVNEGDRYKFGNIIAEVKIKNLDKKLIIDAIKFKKGSWYSAEKLDDSIVKITENIMKYGIPFVKVTPRLMRKEDKTIDITFLIEPSEKKYIDKIIISGNTRTLDKVIRRRLRVAEGDSYNRVLLKRSRILVNNLGHFSKVEFNEVDKPTNANKIVLNIEVEETSTGEFTLGGGYSSTNGAQATIGVSESNFFGTGQKLNFFILTSDRQNSIDFSFTEPFFLNRDLSFSTDIFKTIRQYPESNYDNKTDGVGLGIGYANGEYGRQSIRYSLEQRDIIAYSGASSSIVAESGKNILSLFTLGNTIDKSNSRIDPTEGWYFSNSLGLAGFGGDKKYIKINGALASYSLIFNEKVTLSLSGKTGYVVGLGQDVEISDRFILGDSTFVGFQNGGIGPRDKVDDSALGGNFYYTFTPEMKFGLGLPKELGIKGRTFITAGSLTSIDTSTTNYYDDKSIRLTTGAGVLWQSPFGPIRLDYSYAILKESYDKTETFSFNVGTLF